IYMDAGSGALEPVPEKILTSVKKHTAIPIWVGGGIRNPEQAIRAWQSGADIVVVGNAVEENLQLIKTIASSR
ncbi:MAG: tryptophan synthase subunit alpha, partial [Flavobacteriales bacterium]|nr:tryptophan synthase subunit alpha [Flavobacteriales bacterium]